MSRRPDLSLAVLLLTIVSSGIAHAQTSDNAADLYREAIEYYEARPYEWEEYVPLQQFLDNPTVEPGREARAFLGRYKHALDLYQRASTRGHADFGIDYTQGKMLLLQHLAPMRGIAKLAAADAQLRLFDGDSAGAARRLGGLYGAARNSTDDGVVIGSLIGIAFTALAERATDQAFNRVEFTVNDARILHRALDLFDEVDPFNLAKGFLGEHELLRHELSDLANADYMERRRQLATLESIAATGGELDGHRIAEMNREELNEMLAGHERFIRAAVEIVRMTDNEEATTAMTDLIERVAHDEYGPLAAHTADMCQTVLAQHHTGRTLIKERHDMLEAIIRGENSLTDFASAAYYYMRAIETMKDAASAEELAAIRTVADDSAAAPGESVAATLEHLAPVVECIRLGAARDTCDLSGYRPRLRAMLAAPYAAGLHDLARILDLESRQLLNEAGDSAELVDQIVTTIRFARHLSADTLHMTSAIAHDAFVRALPKLEAVMADAQLADEHRIALRDAVARISRADPFGYGACKVEPFIQWLPRPDVRRPAFERFRTFVGDWSVDRWYFLTAVIEHAFGNDLIPEYAADTAANIEEYRYVTDPDDLARLVDLIDVDALHRARQLTPDVMALIREGDFEAINRLDVPKILNIAGRMQQAKRDLARALRTIDQRSEPRPSGSGSRCPSSTQPVP